MKIDPNGMDPELKAAWVAALRSGAYGQIFGHLKKMDGYCCLGVLCHIAAERFPEHISETPMGMSTFADSDGKVVNDSGEPVQPLRRALGLSGLVMSEAIGRNDEQKQSFAEIADWIERDVPTNQGDV